MMMSIINGISGILIKSTRGEGSMKMKNVYKADLRDFNFLLWDKLKIHENLLTLGPYRQFTKEMVEDILKSARKFAYEQLGPLYQSSDREGCSMDREGNVSTPSGFKELWNEYKKAEWGKLAIPEDQGGLGAPYLLFQVIHEIFLGANPSFITYTGFALVLSYLINEYGTQQLKDLFCKKLALDEWSAAFCVTETEAGSDVGNISTKAVKNENGIYEISGSKVFISAGMHDLTENIVYIVLARVKGAPEGTRGLSAFIVPKLWLNNDGTIAGDNHVRCIGIENKMGLHGCSTAQLSFGDRGPSYGYLLGNRENTGLIYVLEIMNQARISTGIYALGMASSAYLNAAEYASSRVQGVDVRQTFNPNAPRLEIIRHEDIRRMLLEMKSKVEGCRALIFKLSYHHSYLFYYKGLEDNDSRQLAKKHKGIVDLLTPIVKAYTSDQAWRICELGIQILGGYGFTKDYPIEQYARDVKVLSIWEGTNYIQSVDLLRFKLKLGNDTNLFNIFLTEVNEFLDNNKGNKKFEKELGEIGKGVGRLVESFNLLKKLAGEDKINYIFSISTRYLEMMAEVVIAWLLLDSAVISDEKIMNGGLSGSDASFYEGKIASARFYIYNILPYAFTKADIIAGENDAVVSSKVEYFQ
jgi:acyl-CoA dehydrogenase